MVELKSQTQQQRYLDMGLFNRRIQSSNGLCRLDYNLNYNNNQNHCNNSEPLSRKSFIKTTTTTTTASATGSDLTPTTSDQDAALALASSSSNHYHQIFNQSHKSARGLSLASLLGFYELGCGQFWLSVLTECLSCYLYVFIVCSTRISWSGSLIGHEPSLFSMALSSGLAMMLLILTFRSVHVNPALTMAFLFTGRISLIRALIYIIVHCLGALAATTTLFALSVRGHSGALGLDNPHERLAWWQILSIEMVISLLVTLTTYATNNYSSYSDAREFVLSQTAQREASATTIRPNNCGAISSRLLNSSSSSGADEYDVQDMMIFNNGDNKNNNNTTGHPQFLSTKLAYNSRPLPHNPINSSLLQMPQNHLASATTPHPSRRANNNAGNMQHRIYPINQQRNRFHQNHHHQQQQQTMKAKFLTELYANNEEPPIMPISNSSDEYNNNDDYNEDNYNEYENNPYMRAAAPATQPSRFAHHQRTPMNPGGGVGVASIEELMQNEAQLMAPNGFSLRVSVGQALLIGSAYTLASLGGVSKFNFFSFLLFSSSLFACSTIRT